MNASHSGANPFYREHMVLHRCLRQNAQNSCLLWVILFRWLEDASLDKSDWRTFCYILLRKNTNNKTQKKHMNGSKKKTAGATNKKDRDKTWKVKHTLTKPAVAKSFYRSQLLQMIWGYQLKVNPFYRSQAWPLTSLSWMGLDMATHFIERLVLHFIEKYDGHIIL